VTVAFHAHLLLKRRATRGVVIRIDAPRRPLRCGRCCRSALPRGVAKSTN
jgi:hypothetical protein